MSTVNPKNIKDYPSFGALPSPKDLRDYKLSKIASVIELPESFEVPHSSIKNQKTVNSCVAHSVSEILEAYDSINYSTGWIYGYRPMIYYRGQGMYLIDAIKTVHKLGAVENKDFNYNVEVPEAIKIVDENLEKLIDLAKEHKILSYAKLKSNNEIKQAIYTNKIPVMIALPTDTNGLKLKDGIAILPQKVGGHHAVVCYGWNETGFLIQNSWGSSWGNKGCFILPYEYDYTEAWLLTKDSEAVQKPAAYLLRKLLQLLFNWLKSLLNNNN